MKSKLILNFCLYAVAAGCFISTAPAQIVTGEVIVEEQTNTTSINDNTTIGGNLTVTQNATVTGDVVSNSTKSNTIVNQAGTGKPGFPKGLLANTVASFEVAYNSGVITVGTMQVGDVWLVTASPKNFGGGDNRGGSWMVAYSGTVMVIVELFKMGHTVALTDGGGGAVRYSGGGGVPATTIAVLKLTD